MPMGIQPAVHWANMFCFAYEFDFLKRARDAQRMDVLKAFRFTTRYIDDIIALWNEAIKRYLYRHDMDASGLRGIYPDCLVIKLEQESTEQLKYCDVRIYKYAGCWETELYSKLDDPPLLGIDHTPYPHHDSFLADKAMYGIATSHLYRCARICSKRSTFIWWGKRMLSVLAEKSYRPILLKRYTKAFLYKHRYLFGGKWKGMQRDLWLDIDGGWRFRPYIHTAEPT